MLIHLSPDQTVAVISLHSKFCKKTCNYFLLFGKIITAEVPDAIQLRQTEHQDGVRK